MADGTAATLSEETEENETTAVQSLEVGKFTRRWEWQKKWVQVLLSEGQTYIHGFLEG